MSEQIGDSYPEIAQLITDLLPSDFQEGFFSIEMIDDVWGEEMFYRRNNGRYGYINEGLNSITDKFRELRDLFKDTVGEPFSTSTFRLTSAGKFSIDFGYEDVSDFGMASARREIWIKKYLGDNPQIDWM
jgi:hypothetical protein